MSSDLTVSNIANIGLQTGSEDPDVSASGVWSEASVKRPTPWGFRVVAPIVGMILAIAVAPATSVPDYWFFERRGRDTTTVSWVLEGVVGMPISRADALRIARQIMERAEQERLKLTEWEAKRGIQWGDEA